MHTTPKTANIASSNNNSNNNDEDTNNNNNEIIIVVIMVLMVIITAAELRVRKKFLPTCLTKAAFHGNIYLIAKITKNSLSRTSSSRFTWIAELRVLTNNPSTDNNSLFIKPLIGNVSKHAKPRYHWMLWVLFLWLFMTWKSVHAKVCPFLIKPTEFWSFWSLIGLIRQCWWLWGYALAERPFVLVQIMRKSVGILKTCRVTDLQVPFLLLVQSSRWVKC